MSNQEVVERYAEAFASNDIDTLESLIHPEIVVHYPQSGEVIRGRDNFMSIMRNFPGLPDPVDMTMEQSHVAMPSPFPFGKPVITPLNESDKVIGRWIAKYPDESVYHVVMILRIKEGMVAEETSYFGAPFEAPEWRSDWVEIE